jgi:glucose-1-phosphate thymidylyltransferase
VSNWKGLVLAGGSGSRLFPVTTAINKHLLPVYDKPMIYYPLATLMLAGIRDIIIVSGRPSIPQLEALLGDGSQWGLSIVYRVQERPGGIAEGLLVAADDLRGSHVSLILGDNIFYFSQSQQTFAKIAKETRDATIFSYDVANPSKFGCVVLDKQGRPVDIIEKPQQPVSTLAVTGLYFYPPDVLDIASKLKPSPRGELEITDVNLAYLAQDRLKVVHLGRGAAWLDGGTPGDLFEAGQFVKIIEDRTGLKLSCPEEIAWRLGYIDRAALRALAEKTPASDYRDYLLKLE